MIDLGVAPPKNCFANHDWCLINIWPCLLIDCIFFPWLVAQVAFDTLTLTLKKNCTSFKIYFVLLLREPKLTSHNGFYFVSLLLIWYFFFTNCYILHVMANGINKFCTDQWWYTENDSCRIGIQEATTQAHPLSPSPTHTPSPSLPPPSLPYPLPPFYLKVCIHCFMN